MTDFLRVRTHMPRMHRLYKGCTAPLLGEARALLLLDKLAQAETTFRKVSVRLYKQVQLLCACTCLLS